MRWTGRTLLAFGYGTAAITAALMIAFGYGLTASIGIFWMGGAILTVTIAAIRLAFGSVAVQHTRVRVPTNVIRLHPPVNH